MSIAYVLARFAASGAAVRVACLLSGMAWLASQALLAGSVIAQPYPSRPITMIVPFAAGGPSDTLARLTAEHLSRTLGQQIVIENVGAAGGTVGTERAARSAPDGYTLFIHHGALPASMALYANLKYDAATAFETIGLMNTGPMVLTSRKTLETTTAKDVLAYIKANGDKATIAHAGVGSNSYMCGLLIMQAAGARAALVPYRGTGPAMSDTVAGQVDILCDQATTATPQVQAGTVKGYLVTSKQRLAALKDLPAWTEAGVPNFEMAIWNGLYLPRGTPQPIQDAIHAALQKFLDDPVIIERFASTGTVVFPKDMRAQQTHKAFLLAEIDRYKALVASAGLKAEDAK